MADVLYLIGSLQPSSHSRQLVAVAPALRRAGSQLAVIVLDRPSAWSVPLRDAGVPVEELGLTGIFDVRPFFTLRQRLRENRTAVVHTWGRSAFQVARAAGAAPGRFLASGLFRESEKLSWLDRRFLRGVRALAFSATEADRCCKAGLVTERVRPGLADHGEPKRAALPGVREDHDVLLGVGPLEPRKAFREAIYLNDMLRYIEDRSHLILVGDGFGRPALADLVEKFGAESAVSFPGWRADLAPYLARADVVVAPARGPGGVYSVLEAMFAGRPIVASNTPDLVELLSHEETGRLFPVGDRMQFGREVRTLLQSPEARRALGAAARSAALHGWALSTLTDALRDMYRRMA